MAAPPDPDLPDPATDRDAAPGADDRGRPTFGEALRASADLADIAASLLLALFPDRQLYRSEHGGLKLLLVDPPLGVGDAARLERYLHELVARPEWRARHAVVREVRDRGGVRREVRTPVPPAAYGVGEALVGPFDDEASADAWGAEHAPPGFDHDAVRMAGAWLCDVFAAGDDVGVGWEAGPAR